MTIAVMQPYLFPYIGYFQLIGAVDLYISDDDVQYIKSGWISRNRILSGGRPAYFVFSVARNAHTRKINERVFSEEEHGREKRKFLRTLENYRRAPCFEEVFELVSGIMRCDDVNVAAFVLNSIRGVCRYLEIETPMQVASQVECDRRAAGQARVIDLCLRSGADAYINAIGGVELYSREAFNRRGLRLQFLKTRELRYKQFGNPFVPDLSIIDVMMFNRKDEIRAFLDQYDLV